MASPSGGGGYNPNPNANYVVNVVPLFNLANNDGGIDSNAALTSNVAKLQAMIDTTDYVINANKIRSFNSGQVDIPNDVHITGDLYINGSLVNPFGSSGFAQSASSISISTGSVGFFLQSTNTSKIPPFVYGTQLYGSTVFGYDISNNFYFQPFNSNIGSVNISSLNFYADQASYLSSLELSGNATVHGSTFLTTLLTNNVKASTILTSNINFGPTNNIQVNSNLLYFNCNIIGGTLAYAFEYLTF